MQPLGHSSNSGHIGKCQEIGSKCVIWDGPDISCLGVNLCKGQSIEVVMYHTAKRLCEVLDALNISVVDLACLTPPAGATIPDTPNQLFQLIIDKLCLINADVIALQNTGSALIDVPLPPCLEFFIPDPNGGPDIKVTSLLLIDPVTNTSPIAAYLANEICDLVAGLTTAQSEITALQIQVQQILNNISGALPSVNMPPCIIPGGGTLPIADPSDPDAGAVVAIANTLCDVINNITGDPNSNYPLTTSCFGADLSTGPAYGSYPGQVVSSMADLGVIANPNELWQVVNNMMLAICDLRNFASIVKATCCPTLCANIAVDIGAVIPGPPPPGPPNRGIVRFFLNGSFLDVVTNTTVNSAFGFAAFTPPGYSVGGPAVPPPVGPQWDINYPVTITITDSALPVPNVFTPATAPFLDDFATLNSYLDFNVTAGPVILDTTTDYTVQYSVTVAAPDGTFCTFTDSILLATTCDNQPVSAVTVSNIAANGFTLTFTQPIVAGGTTLQSYTFTITQPGPGGQVISIPNVPPGFHASGYYIYPSELDYPGTPVPPFPGNAWQLNSQIQENTTYDVTVTAVYNCGQSNPVGAASSFTTLVGLIIDIGNLPNGTECLNSAIAGRLTLIPPPALPPGSITGNFTQPITFTGLAPVTAIVGAVPGLQFTYTFETLALKDGLWTVNNSPPAQANCNAVANTRCWGQATTAKYYPGIAPTDSFTSPGLLEDFELIGCYDYIVSNFTASNGLTIAAGTSSVVTNINDGGGTGSLNTKHGTYQYSYIAPLNSLTMPTQNCNLVITNAAHVINGGNRPAITIIINDPLDYIFEKWSMWYGVSGASNPLPTDTQSVDGVEHTAAVQSILSGVPAPPVNKWTGTGDNDNPVGLPIFMRLAVHKWTGSGYAPPIYPTTTANASVGIIDVTPYWIALPNIETTGFQINQPVYGLNIGLRDKIIITFTGGITNDGSNPNYAPTSPSPIATNVAVPSSVTITQDPFVGIFPDVLPSPNLQTGPFTITGNSPKNAANGVSYDDAVTNGWAYNVLPNVTKYGVPLNNLLPGNNPSATTNTYSQSCEFVVSGDMTITWSVG